MKASATLLVTTALASLSALAFAAAAAAETYVVNKPGDHPPDPGPARCTERDCTLREAVLDANESLGVADRIVLPSRKRAYQLRIGNVAPSEDGAFSGDLDVGNDPLRIVRRGRGRATIDANGIDRHFQVFAGAGLALRGLKLVGGVANPADAGGDGGAVHSDAAPLRLLNTRLTGNFAPLGGRGGAVFAVDTASPSDPRGLVGIRRSVLSRNLASGDGGAIYTRRLPVRVGASTIHSNRSREDGGGTVAINSTGRINASTMSSNRADEDGGGLFASDSELAIVNSTFSANRADLSGGGIYADITALEVSFSTLVRNRAAAAGVSGMAAASGGGISARSSEVTVGSALIAANTGPAGREDCAGQFESAGHNLVLAPAPKCSGFDRRSDIVGERPRLAQLARNGGPTRTHALRRRSPAVDRGGRRGAPNRDQRGQRRDRRPDIGAYERR